MRYTKNCEYCRKQFETNSKKAKFCSDTHRQFNHRKKHGIPDPDFMLKSAPKTAENGNFSGLGTTQTAAKPKSFLNKRDNSEINRRKQAIERLILLRNNLQSQLEYQNGLWKQLQQDQTDMLTVVGTIVGSSMVERKDDFANTVFKLLAGGGIGYLAGKAMYLSPKERERQLGIIVQNIRQLRQKIKFVNTEIRAIQNQPTPTYAEPQAKPGFGANPKVMNSNEVIKQKYATYEFTEPWSNFLGNPSKNFSAIIYGLPKSGKSNLALQFASYLSRSFGKTLYIAAEEGFGQTIKDKLTFTLANNQNLDIGDLKGFSEIQQTLRKKPYDFVFIDSINVAGIEVSQLGELRQLHSSTAFISVMQATKQGSFKGSQEFAHNCDIIINVENGRASQIGRFNAPAEFEIFPHSIR